jgi:ATP-dependent 26S proteasome regulatory subunit
VENYLFIILPNRTYVTLDTFSFNEAAETWSTEEVIPQVFLATLAHFDEKLRFVETSFAPLLTVWDARERLSRASSQLQAIGRSAEAWRRVRLPEAQKLDILRRMELFENGDPAAPRGLLLHGPSGTGKSLVARTLAETLNCDFQKLSIADIKQEHLGASGRRVREIWERARANRPSIIFIDDCEGVFGAGARPRRMS